MKPLTREEATEFPVWWPRDRVLSLLDERDSLRAQVAALALADTAKAAEEHDAAIRREARAQFAREVEAHIDDFDPSDVDEPSWREPMGRLAIEILALAETEPGGGK